MSQEPQPTDPGQQLRQHLFEGDLLELPPPEEAPEFIPSWFTGPLPVLVYPPLQEQGVSDGDTINLEVTPYHLYYGALREFAESGDEERCALLRQLVLEWNPNAALEVSRLGREKVHEDVETALLHYELAQELDPELYEAFQNGGMCHYALATLGEEDPADALEAAEQMFRQAIELRPESGLSWWSLAYVFHAAGTVPKAEECLRQFLIHYPEASERDLAEGTLQHGFPSLDLGEQLPFFLDLAAQESANPSDEQRIFAEAQALAFGQDPARAVELLQPLAQAYPDTGEIWFILGADSLADLPRWRRADEIIALARLAAAQRPGTRLDLAALDARLPGIASRVELFDGPRLDIASSDLRARRAAGLPLRYQTPDPVIAFIEAHGLYKG